MTELPTLAVVGATGAAGSVLCELLSSRKNVWGEVRLVASDRYHRRTVVVRGAELPVHPAGPDVLDGMDVAVFATPPEVAAGWAPRVADAGTVVIDGTGAFRADRDVPVVVPEINPTAVRNRPRGIVASPHATTLAMIVSLAALHHEYGLRALVLATYQAASASGRPGVQALLDQLGRVAGDGALGSRPGNVRQALGDDLGPFAAPVALNVLPWSGTPADGGWSSDELAVRDDTRRILGLPDLKVVTTCVQVPVVTGHSVAVHAVFSTEVDVPAAREALRHAPGVIMVDDPAAGEFPMPIDAVGTDPSWVGRLRRSLDDPRALEYFATGDNLRKGAALNCLQIAELVAPEVAPRSRR